MVLKVPTREGGDLQVFRGVPVRQFFVSVVCFGIVSMCPQMQTEIQIGPTGRKLLPLSVVK